MPADGPTDGYAAESLQGAWTCGDGPDVLGDFGAAFSRLELVVDGRADAGDAGVEVWPAERGAEHVEDVEGSAVVVARVDVEAPANISATDHVYHREPFWYRLRQIDR